MMMMIREDLGELKADRGLNNDPVWDFIGPY